MNAQNHGSTQPLRCGHCGNVAPFTIKAVDSRVVERSHELMTWDAGDVFQIMECPSCRGVIFGKYAYHEHFCDEGVEYQILYPTERGFPIGLPDSVSKAFEAAQSVKNINANSLGVSLRRVMEVVCKDRGAIGKTLNEQLQDLSKRKEIPSKLVDVANGVRNLGNVGAHAGLGELTSEEVSILDDLTRAILEYVYSAPLLALKAQGSLQKLKSGIDKSV